MIFRRRAVSGGSDAPVLVFDDEGGRDAHLSGKVAANLMANLKVDPATALLADGSLLAVPPVIEKVDLLGSK